ncbi:MAG: hypothetical protein IJ733_15305 [Lachnospiraceae bacterium]|nr:hypothetical protein [Lachnospiraceae bacterium]
MKEISLTYYDTDLGIANYLMLYFRMIGVFVHERILSDEYGFEKYQMSERAVDADIIIWHSEFSGFNPKRDKNEDSICICEQMDYDVAEQFFDTDRIVGYTKGTNFLFILREVIKKLFQDESAIHLLEFLAEVFEKNKILEAFMGSRFNIPDYDIYEKCCKRFEKAFDEIGHAMDEDVLIDEDPDWHAAFSMLYLAFECNYAMKRLKDVFYFDAKSILEALNDIKEDNGTWLSLEILIGQIYDDLLDKREKAKDYYILAAKQLKSSFAWYKLGLIYKQRDRNYTTALYCMENALALDPMYFKAIRHAGDCKLSLEEPEEAIDYYLSLLDRLERRKEMGVMRVIEAEYYYKTCMQMGSLREVRQGNHLGGLKYYQKAAEL